MHYYFLVEILPSPNLNFHRYMEDGFFLDRNTQNVKMTLLAFNADAQQYMLTEAEFSFPSSGVIPIDTSISMFRRWPYESYLDFFRLFLEILFLLLIIFQVYNEMKECAEHIKAAETCYQAVCAYWTDFNNIVDWVSMGLTVFVMVLWFNIVSMMYQFNPKSCYHVYIETPDGLDCKSARYACMHGGNKLRHYDSFCVSQVHLIYANIKASPV